ncbi:MAG TPA: sulfotransferase [Solirubrobacteraceae bacterium]|nr:sulfotransferase [Solirubrobacteraceae bacterium]
MTTSSEAAVSAPRPPLKVPDFFIVGHAKSGTTALYEMLRPHPQIYMSEVKEPWYFCTDMRPRFHPWRTGVAPQTLEEYLSLFQDAEPGQRIGEASSSYLWSRTAARGIAEVQPSAKIIAILREPASFLRSLHLQLLQNHVEVKRDLRTAMSLEDARRQGRRIPRRSHRPQMLHYSDHVRYVEQLRRYHELFPREQVLVLVYDDFRRDNEAFLRTVLRFLEVDETWPIQVLDTNPSVAVRSQQLDDLVHAVSVGRGPVTLAAKRAIKALAPREARRRLLEFTRQRIVHGAPPPPDERFLLELRRRFKPEVQALSEYLDRDLVSLWGYDRLD